MRLHEHFLNEDLHTASKEYHCFKDCLELTVLHLENGDVELAKQRSIDVTKSLHELSKLADKKNKADKQDMLVQHMIQQGINIQFIRRHFNDY